MIINTILVISKDHKQFFSQHKDPKDRFEMISQVCEKNKVFKRKHRENTCEKLQDRYEIEEQKQISQNLIFFDFFKTLKTNKM